MPCMTGWIQVVPECDQACERLAAERNEIMKTPPMQMSLMGWLILIGVVAGHIWLFRQSVLWGILGLTFTKHIVIAYLCQVLGVDKEPRANPAPAATSTPHSHSLAVSLPANRVASSASQNRTSELQ